MLGEDVGGIPERYEHQDEHHPKRSRAERRARERPPSRARRVARPVESTPRDSRSGFVGNFLPLRLRSVCTAGPEGTGTRRVRRRRDAVCTRTGTRVQAVFPATSLLGEGERVAPPPFRFDRFCVRVCCADASRHGGTRGHGAALRALVLFLAPSCASRKPATPPRARRARRSDPSGARAASRGSCTRATRRDRSARRSRASTGLPST